MNDNNVWKEYLVSNMMEFFSDEYKVNKLGELELVVSDEYKRQVKKYDPKKKNPLKASLLWFESLGAIGKDDIKMFYKIRERRNEITHELLDTLIRNSFGW